MPFEHACACPEEPSERITTKAELHSIVFSAVQLLEYIFSCPDIQRSLKNLNPLKTQNIAKMGRNLI